MRTQRKPARGEHLHFARLRIGEVDVDAQPLGHDRAGQLGGRQRVRTKQEAGREQAGNGKRLHGQSPFSGVTGMTDAKLFGRIHRGGHDKQSFKPGFPI